MECPEHPLSAATLPWEVPTLGGKGTWSGVGGKITFGSEVSGTLAWIRTWGVDGGGTIYGCGDICHRGWDGRWRGIPVLGCHHTGMGCLI